MKKIVIIFAIVGLVVGVAYASLDELLEHYGTDKAPESNEESSASLKEIFKKEYREDAEIIKIMSEARAEVDAEFQEQTEQTNKSLIVAVFSSIPDVIWAAIIASGLTLSGVYLSNRGNRKCLLVQLNHAAQEKDKEQKMSLRRDIFISAVAKIGQQLSYLVGFYNTSKASPEGYYEALRQIDVVGSDETIATLNQFNDHMVETFTELIPMKDEINLLEERGKILMEIVGQGIEKEKKVREYEKVFVKKFRLTYDLAAKCQQKAQRAEELLTPIIVAIRKEMDTPFDEEAYRAMMERSHDKWKEGLENYVTSMKELAQQGIKTLIKDAGLPTDSTDSTKDDNDGTVSIES